MSPQTFTFDVIINPIILLAGIIGGGLVGFVIGKARLAKSQSRVRQLEVELMQANQETLESQRAYVALESKLQDQAIPVISMKINGTQNPKEKASK